MSLRQLRDWTRWVWNSLCSLWPRYKCIGGWTFKSQQYFWSSCNETWICWWYSSEYWHRCISNYQRFQKVAIRLSKHWAIRYMNDRRSSERSRTKSKCWYGTWTSSEHAQTGERFGFVTSALPDPRAITSIGLLVHSMTRWMLKLKQMISTLVAMTATLLLIPIIQISSIQHCK